MSPRESQTLQDLVASWVQCVTVEREVETGRRSALRYTDYQVRLVLEGRDYVLLDLPSDSLDASERGEAFARELRWGIECKIGLALLAGFAVHEVTTALIQRSGRTVYLWPAPPRHIPSTTPWRLGWFNDDHVAQGRMECLQVWLGTQIRTITRHPGPLRWDYERYVAGGEA